VDADQVPRVVVTATDCCPPPAAGCHDEGDTHKPDPACDTVRVAVAPPAVNVNTPWRADADVFAGALTATLSPEAPLVGDTDNQEASDDTDQEAWFVVGTTVVEPPTAGGDQTDADRNRVAAGAAWVTVKVAVAPPAVNVTTPCRAAADGFAKAMTDVDQPDAPVSGAVNNQSTLDDTDQEAWFVVGTTVLEPPYAGACQVDSDRNKTGGKVAVIV
jgi:hypothetical protein